VFLGIALFLTLVVLWLYFHHIPSWYEPVQYLDADLQEIRAQTGQWVDDIGDQLVQGKRFEVTLQQGQVNAFLAALPKLWPDVEQSWPTSLRQPALAFQNGQIRIGALITRNRWQAVISTFIAIDVSQDLQQITVRLDQVNGGSLVIPAGLVENYFNRILKRLHTASSPHRSYSNNPWQQALQQVDDAGELFTGVAVHNRFVWPNGKRRFRIVSIRAQMGRLIIAVEPL